MKRTVTTTEAADLAHVPRRIFRAWAAQRGLEPLHRVRIGRSFIVVWSVDQLIEAGTRHTDSDVGLTSGELRR